MLNIYSLNAVSVLAQRLAEQGVALSAVNGTLLSEANTSLTSYTDGPGNSLVTEGEGISGPVGSAHDYAESLRLLSEKVTLEEKQSDHTLVMDRGAILVAESISKSLSFARSVVQPFVDTICTQVEERLNGIVLADAGCLSIVPDCVPEIWDNPSFISMYKKFDTIPFDTVVLERIHPPMDYDEIAARMRTGSPTVDKLVDGLIATVGKHLIEDVYLNVFVKPDANVNELLSRNQSKAFPYLYGNVNDYLKTTDDVDRNIPVIIFLLASRLMEDIPDGINLSLDSYQNYMTKIMVQAGRTLNAIDKITADRQAGNRVVKSWPGVTPDKADPVNGMIRVDEKLYKAWLGKGGSPEVLFGVYVTQDFAKAAVDFDALLDETLAARYKVEWNHYYAARETLAVSQRQSNVHNALAHTLHAFVRDTEESPMIREDKTVIQKRIYERMKVIRPEQYGDEDLLILHVVVDVFFPTSDAKFILISMANCEKANPGIKPREASLDASLELLADWLVDNFLISTAA